MRLFAALDATWPALERRRLNDWTLRRGGGAGNRASSATLDAPTGEAMDGFAAVEAAMRGWGQRPQVMVRPGEAALDAALAARGYAVGDRSMLYAAPVAAVALAAPEEGAIDCEGPLAAMTAIWAAGGIGPARRAVMDRAAGPKTWLLGRLGQRPAACAFVALDAEVAMLHALEVTVEVRRRGMGALLTRAAAAWAAERGATTLALAVTEANRPARALYAALGLAPAGSYHYRLAPES